MSLSMPIYRQLVESIKDKIKSGELGIGDKLESERAMSLRYGINRMTVRKALKILEEEGIITSIHGSGTYVNSVSLANEKLDMAQNGIMSLSRQIRQKGMRSSRKLLSFQKIACIGNLKENFPHSEYLYEIIRLSLINDNPYALQKTYIPCSMFYDAERFDFEFFSLYDYMDDQGYRPKKMYSYLQIDKVPEEYCEIMNVSKNKKVFLFEYNGYTADDILVEYTISYHHPNYTLFKYSVES